MKARPKKSLAIQLLALVIIALCILGVIGAYGCSSDTSTTSSDTSDEQSGDISVYSREDGSGTRGAFVELFGLEEEDSSGNSVDMTTSSAVITNSTSVMMTSVAGDPNAIGYISLGSLNDSVKAVEIDGIEATPENVANESYHISRPFNIVTTDEVSEEARDFINYILSSEGQAIVEDENYIAVDTDAASYSPADVEGKVVVAGSSSVTPVMEKLAEAYEQANPNVTVEVQQSDSTTGINMVLEGTCDIGMASRELKESETESGASSSVIAIDGIAVIVPNESSITNLTTDQVKSIFSGETTSWSEIDN